jgi:hypothetical protein
VLDNLAPDTLPRLLRRTTLSALIVGVLGFVVALLIAPPLGAVGEALGVAAAIVNLRLLDRQVARVELGGEQSTKAVRRRLGARTMSRLGAMTVVVVLAVLLSAPLGIGIVSGLVLYQIVFVANVFRIVATQGGTE